MSITNIPGGVGRPILPTTSTTATSAPTGTPDAGATARPGTSTPRAVTAHRAALHVIPDAMPAAPLQSRALAGQNPSTPATPSTASAGVPIDEGTRHELQTTVQQCTSAIAHLMGGGVARIMAGEDLSADLDKISQLRTMRDSANAALHQHGEPAAESAVELQQRILRPQIAALSSADQARLADRLEVMAKRVGAEPESIKREGKLAILSEFKQQVKDTIAQGSTLQERDRQQARQNEARLKADRHSRADARNEQDRAASEAREHTLVQQSRAR